MLVSILHLSALGTNESWPHCTDLAEEQVVARSVDTSLTYVETTEILKKITKLACHAYLCNRYPNAAKKGRTSGAIVSGDSAELGLCRCRS